MDLIIYIVIFLINKDILVTLKVKALTDWKVHDWTTSDIIFLCLNFLINRNGMPYAT